MSGMGALGAFLTTYAGVKDDRRKEDLAAKLQKERDDRQDQYDQNREARAEKRDRAKPSGAPTFLANQDGSYTKIYKNSFGDEIKREAATPDEVEDVNMTKQERHAKLEDALMDPKYKQSLIDKTNSDIGDAPLDRQLKRENLESLIQSRADNTTDRRNAEEDRRKGKVTDEDAATLAQARSMIGKRIQVKDGTTGKHVTKIATPEFVAEWLRQKGRPKLADEIFKDQ